MLGIGARVRIPGTDEGSPKHVWETEMRPTLMAALRRREEERVYHAALQRIGYALGLPVGSDLTTQCIPAIEAMRRDVERLNLGAVILSHRADEWGNTRTEFTGVDLRQAIDDAARSRARAEVQG
ncbi:hypothetical protein LL972_21140 [Xanthomonas campestris pv. asclepiadis]|nr:hypothetical protein [Xanthomonas campestris pv. asclepiadis]